MTFCISVGGLTSGSCSYLAPWDLASSWQVCGKLEGEGELRGACAAPYANQVVVTVGRRAVIYDLVEGERRELAALPWGVEDHGCAAVRDPVTDHWGVVVVGGGGEQGRGVIFLDMNE